MKELNRGDKLYLDSAKIEESAVNIYLDARDGVAEAYENFISQNSKSMKDFKLLPINLFGELLQCLYDSEVNMSIEWTWDGGFDWGFGLEKSASTIALEKRIENTNLEEVGGLIINEYLSKFDGLDSEGKPNKMHCFLGKKGFLKKTKT